MKLIESSPLSCRGAMLSSIYERISHRYKMEYRDPLNDKDIGVYLYIGSTHVGTCIRSIIYSLESFIGFSFERDYNDKQLDSDKSIKISISLDKIKAMHDENRKTRINRLLDNVLDELTVSCPNVGLSYVPKENNNSLAMNCDILITVQEPTVDQHVEIDYMNNSEPYLTKIWRFEIPDNFRNLLAELMSYDAFKEECPVSFDLTI